MRSVVLYLLLAASPAQQFNLVCTGKLAVVALGVNSEEPYTRTIRVDLANKQWCADACSDVHSIARVEPGRIWLKDEDRDTPRERLIERESVDRVSGDHASVSEDRPQGPNPRSVFRLGHCEKAAFTGFLSAPTKF